MLPVLHMLKYPVVKWLCGLNRSNPHQLPHGTASRYEQDFCTIFRFKEVSEFLAVNIHDHVCLLE